MTDAAGVPVGVAADAGDVSEVHLGPAALADVCVHVPWGVPVVADRAYDSDPLRDELAGEGYTLVARHRRNRVRAPTNDGRRLRRLSRRWVIERTFSWLHSFRWVVTRFERDIGRYDGLVRLACAFIALNKLL